MAVQHVKLTNEQEKRLKMFLDDHLSDIETNRAARIANWRKWREQYEGKTGPKNFPWPGASNVFVPQTAIDVDTIHANMMNRLFGHERVWDVHALRGAEQVAVNPADGQKITWSTLAKATEEYLNKESGPGGLVDFYSCFEDESQNAVGVGTAILYNPWVTLTQPDYQYDPISGQVVKEKEVTVFDGLKPQGIPLEDFLIVPFYPEIHGPLAAPLFGHQAWLRRGQVYAKAMSGKYRYSAKSEQLARVLAAPGHGDQDSATSVKDARAANTAEGQSFGDARRHDYLIQHLWVRVQLDPDQPEVRLYVQRHAVTGVLLGVQPWPYKTAPYHVLRYLRRPGDFYGIGVAELLESIQKGINTTFNQSVDNATVANMRCFKVKAGSNAARQFGDIYPGKKIIVNSPDELEPFQLGEVYPSSFQVGLNLRDFAERRTGINDPNLGQQNPAHATASATMALIQESGRRFDLYAKDMRKTLGELGMQSLELIAQHNPSSRVFATMEPEKAMMVEAALSSNAASQIREQIRVMATSASGSSNRETERQASVTVFGIVTQYLERLAPLAPVLIDPNTPEKVKMFVYEMSQLGELVMQRILNSFDMPELAKCLPQTEKLLQQQQQQQGAMDVQSQQAQGAYQDPGAMGGPGGMGAAGALPGGPGGPSGGGEPPFPGGGGEGPVG